MSENLSWQPILRGELADRAWRAILEIADALEETPVLAGEVAGRGASLAGGRSGLALFFTYLALARDDEAMADRAETQIDLAIDALATTAMSPGLYSGFTGVAWTARHLEGRLYESPVENEEDDIDRVLAELLDQPAWNREYDLISGLAGFAIHALESLPRPLAEHALKLNIDHLASSMVDVEPGRSWFTPPEWLTDRQLELHPEGHFNLGVAHGVPGVLVVLARAARQGVRTHQAEKMIEAAVTWLLAQDRAKLGFPSWVPVLGGEVPTRLAWCYGDPGLALALLRTARLLERRDWEEEALRIARRFAQWPVETSGVRDAGLCHGAIGLAHLYNRLFQGSGEELFAEQARFWFEQGLDMARPGKGVAGFSAYLPRPGTHIEWRDDPGFLTGAAGVALGLLAAVSDLEPEWDRVMAIDLPPAR